MYIHVKINLIILYIIQAIIISLLIVSNFAIYITFY